MTALLWSFSSLSLLMADFIVMACRTAALDDSGSSLHLDLAKEGARVLGGLADFNLLYHFSEGDTTAGPIFPYDPYTLCAFSHVSGTEAQAPKGRDTMCMH